MIETLKQRGITHAKIAERAGVDRSHVTRQLRGQRTLTREVARAISQLLREADRRRLREAAEILERGGWRLVAQEVASARAGL